MAGYLLTDGLAAGEDSSAPQELRNGHLAVVSRPLSFLEHVFRRRTRVSHIVEIQTEVRDEAAVRAACQRLRLPEPVHGSHRLFSAEVTGLGVNLPDWRYPAVCQLDTGEIRYDNYGGRWGEQQHLDRFVQMYAVEKAKAEARRWGNTCTEQRLADCSIKLTVNVGGAA